MKRLMDDSTDELVRSLLAAGIEHRPPPGNKARVIMALGAGGAAGLFSSNAFAWLSTTAGKVTAVGVAVSVAGAVWVAVPSAQQARSGHAARSIATPSATDPLGGAASAGAMGESASATASPVGRDVTGSGVVGSGAENGGRDSAANDSGEGVRLADARAAGADARDSEPTASATADADERGATSARRERGARKASRKASSKAALSRAALAKAGSKEKTVGVQAGAETLPAGGALDWSAPEQAALDAVALDAAALDAEVKLVDDMHWAARRNDRAALGRFIEQYRATFPEGQLKNEVAEFAARVDRADPSGAR